MKKILLTSCVLFLLGASSFAQNKAATKQAPKLQKAISSKKAEAVKAQTPGEKKSLGLTKPQATKTVPAAASLAEWNASKSGN